jgi:hypothetical protein
VNARTLQLIADEFSESVDYEALELADWLDAQDWSREDSREKARRAALLLRSNQPLKKALLCVGAWEVLEQL